MGGIKAFFDGFLNKGKKKKTSSAPAVRNEYSYTFKASSAWEAAAREYRRLAGKAADAELTEEEKKKIYDYTMVPISYYFGWLCERDMIGEGFVSELGEERAKLIEDVKNGKITALEALISLDHYFSYGWIKEEYRYFFRKYYHYGSITEDSFNDDDVYLYDYYECNGEPEERYYCIEYSAEVQKKICQRLDERYARYGAGLSWEDLRDNFYSDEEDDEHVSKMHSDFFDKDLQVYRFGRIRKGEFPEDYARKCLKCLEAMPQKELRRLERWLLDNYGSESEELNLSHFDPYDLNIFEPQAEGDLAFMISGEADYEEEHGISFTIRNGIMLDWGYANESGDPYSDELLERYERFSYGTDPKSGAKGIDFEQIKEQKDLDALLAEGKLIRTSTVPDWLGGADPVYVTPLTQAKIEKIHKRLKMIRTYAAIVYPEWNFHVDVTPEYYENTDGTRSPVPMRIGYWLPWRAKPVYISMSAVVWE